MLLRTNKEKIFLTFLDIFWGCCKIKLYLNYFQQDFVTKLKICFFNLIMLITVAKNNYLTVIKKQKNTLLNYEKVNLLLFLIISFIKTEYICKHLFMA